MHEADRTSLGLDANLAAALSYLLGWVTGAAFLLMERRNRFVRFHAMQSTVLFAGLCLACAAVWAVPRIGVLLVVFLLVPASAVLWLLLMFRAYRGQRFRLPVVGRLAEARSGAAAGPAAYGDTIDPSL